MVDITVHEQTENGTLKELRQASGADSVSKAVDDNFISMVANIYGKQNLEQLKDQNINDYISIHRSFETERRNMKNIDDITVIIPINLSDISGESDSDFNQRLSEVGLNGTCTKSGERFRIGVSVVRELFKGPMNRLVRQLKTLFKQDNVDSVNTI